MRHTRINLRLGLELPRARITLRPELARSSWLDTMMGMSLRKIGRDRQGEQCKEVCFWLVLSRGFPPAGASSRVPDTQQSHLRHDPVWHSRYINLGSEERSLRALPKCYMLVSRVLAFTGQRTGS
jgi:hypothetical protein